ncbi:Mur ligase family protein [Ruegeria sp. 2205SS24-7]|uniref:Mur ligase family protein n=1 Tax=Ruegeria discodermiae TaxID=3064389 RepID=UPI002741291C|nr:Mur ligase family protein [Ruegeria sp. 2205SS24-7]MDP5220670.1 Mur ligase family protein [Ruegeria sp. 2205SS24-7]
MQTCLQVRSLQFFHGSKHEITGRTALLDLKVTGPLPDQVLAQLDQPDGLRVLSPQEAAGFAQDRDWVAGLLVGGRGSSGLADMAAALIVLLQLWARMPVHKGQVLDARSDRIRLALPWRRQQLFRNATDLMIALLTPEADEIEMSRRLDRFLEQERRGGLAPNSMRFAQAAMARDMPVTVLNQQTLRIGWGARARQLRSSFTDRTGSLAEKLARDKYFSLQRLKQAALPVPEQRFVRTPDEARVAAAELGWPVVLKPVALDQGRGVHVGITSEEALVGAFYAANTLQDRGVLVEAFVPGDDHRLLVVNGQMMMAARRIPGGITGDGKQTVDALLDQVNADPQRGSDPRNLLIEIRRDDEALACLKEAGLTPDSIPEAGRFVPLRRTANVSTGGTAVDVTDIVHPDNRGAAIRAVRLVGLDIAGVDFLCRDISVSYRVGGGAICEVNGQPGFRPHWLSAPERDINGEVLDALFAGQPARIPTAAITGTNGKSTTAMMLHHIWQNAGKTAGVCTTVGTWIDEDKVDTQNLSGLPGAELLLGDPAVEAAVLEMPRLGLIRFGQACDRYDVAALLNVQNDHLGQNGIDTLEEMARLKSSVLQHARTAVVVNAEDSLCLQALEATTAPRRILVAMAATTPALAAHLESGGDGVFVATQDDADWIVMARGTHHVPVMNVADIPATMGGLLHFNVMNAMFAIALADAQSVPADAIRTALASFANTREKSPGRYNMIDGFACPVLVDYAHNDTAVAELCRVVRALPVTGRRLLALQILGNSGPHKLENNAAHLLESFDRIAVLPDLRVIRKYGYFTGDDPEEEMRQLSRETLIARGASDGQILTGPDSDALVEQVMHAARPDDLVVLMMAPQDAFGHVDRLRTHHGARG